jgi:hypothetical protein
MTFTVPEINLICLYVGESKHDTIGNIISAIPDFTEHEFTKLAESAIYKLEPLTEAEFAEYNFREQFSDAFDEYEQ